MIDVKSREEAIEWAKRCPAGDGEMIEVRQVYEAADFPPEVLTPDLTAREQAMGEQLKQQAAKP